MNKSHRPGYLYVLISFIYSTDNGGDVYKLSRSLAHSEIGTTEEYLKDFKSWDARNEHDTYSFITRLKQAKKDRRRKPHGLFG